MFKQTFLICLLVFLANQLYAQVIIERSGDLIVINTDFNIGEINEKISIMRHENGIKYKVGTAIIVKCHQGKTVAKILNEYRFVKVQTGDFVEGWIQKYAKYHKTGKIGLNVGKAFSISKNEPINAVAFDFSLLGYFDIGYTVSNLNKKYVNANSFYISVLLVPYCERSHGGLNFSMDISEVEIRYSKKITAMTFGIDFFTRKSISQSIALIPSMFISGMMYSDNIPVFGYGGSLSLVKAGENGFLYTEVGFQKVDQVDVQLLMVVGLGLLF